MHNAPRLLSITDCRMNPAIMFPREAKFNSKFIRESVSDGEIRGHHASRISMIRKFALVIQKEKREESNFLYRKKKKK